MSKTVKPDPGVFLVKGDMLSIAEFVLKEDGNGKFKLGPVVLKTGIDMIPFWLSIAFQHMKACERAHNKLMIAKESKNDKGIAVYLKKESSSGMQAVVSVGIAIDAYYATLKDYIKIPKSLSKTWRDKRTARHKQIAEVMRLTFPMKNDRFKTLRVILEQIFKWRDMAVHPRAGTSGTELHAELNKITDWRYSAFRFYNVKAIYGMALSVLYTTNKLPVNKNKDVQKYCDTLTTKLEPLVKSWKRKYGPLP